MSFEALSRFWGRISFWGIASSNLTAEFSDRSLKVLLNNLEWMRNLHALNSRKKSRVSQQLLCHHNAILAWRESRVPTKRTQHNADYKSVASFWVIKAVASLSISEEPLTCLSGAHILCTSDFPQHPQALFRTVPNSFSIPLQECHSKLAWR